jgi:hypothetical protein
MCMVSDRTVLRYPVYEVSWPTLITARPYANEETLRSGWSRQSIPAGAWRVYPSVRLMIPATDPTAAMPANTPGCDPVETSFPHG